GGWGGGGVGGGERGPALSRRSWQHRLAPCGTLGRIHQSKTTATFAQRIGSLGETPVRHAGLGHRLPRVAAVCWAPAVLFRGGARAASPAAGTRCSYRSHPSSLAWNRRCRRLSDLAATPAHPATPSSSHLNRRRRLECHTSPS